MSAQETKVVPVEPTNAMIDAIPKSPQISAREIYKAMLAAAPSSEPATDDGELARLEPEQYTNFATYVFGDPKALAALERDIAMSHCRYQAGKAVDSGRVCFGLTDGWFRARTYCDLMWFTYLYSRGMLEEHPTDPNLVRVKGEGHAS